VHALNSILQIIENARLTIGRYFGG
jgi:hypothetical protein